MASLSVSSLRLRLLLLLLLKLLQFCLFFFLTASQIQEYHFCFFWFLTITECLFLSNFSRRLEDLNLDLLCLCLSTLSGRPIFLHHFSIFPPAIVRYSLHLPADLSDLSGFTRRVRNQSYKHNLLSFGNTKIVLTQEHATILHNFLFHLGEDCHYLNTNNLLPSKILE